MIRPRQQSCIPCFSLKIRMWVKARNTLSKPVLCEWQPYTTPKYLSGSIFLSDFHRDPTMCLKICVEDMLTLRQGEALQALHPTAGTGCLIVCLGISCSLPFFSNLSLTLFLRNTAIGEFPINHAPHCWKNPTHLSAGKHTPVTKEKTVSSF